MNDLQKSIESVALWCIDQVENEGLSKETITDSILTNIENPSFDKRHKQILNGVLNRLTKLGYTAV